MSIRKNTTLFRHTPSLEKRDDTTHEEQPYTPTGCPETTARALADGASVESVVNQMLEILCHSHLTHELVLVPDRTWTDERVTRSTPQKNSFVPVHSSKSADMSEYVLNSIRKLECVYISQAELNVGVNDELGES